MRTRVSFFGFLGLTCLLAAAGPGCGGDDDDDDGGAAPLGPRLRADWQTVWFDTVRGRPESEPLAVEVTNDGDGATLALETDLVGDVHAFRIADDQCAGRALQPGTSCSIALVLGAGELGPFEGALRVQSRAAPGRPGAQLELPIRGKMGGAELRLSVDQSSQNVGLGSTMAFTITVENAGGLLSGPVAVSSAGPFALAGECEGRRLVGGEACAMTATYAAPLDASIGPVSAQIAVEAEPGGAASVAVTANVINVGALLVPDADFGVVPTVASPVKTVTVSNPSAVEATVTGVSVVSALPDIQDVVVDRDGCTGVALAPQGSCELDVRVITTYRLEPIDATLTVQSNRLQPGVGLVRGTRVRAHYGIDILLDEASTGDGGVSFGGSASPLPVFFVGPNGTPQTLHAVPNTGSVFLGWSGACSGTADCVLTPPDNTDVEVRARFGASL